MSFSVSVLEGVGPMADPLKLHRHGKNIGGKKWAILVAGSNGYGNYRHQADICHAYQILKKGGLKDENIVVFMYDDIAFDPQNPRAGVIINKPNGPNVYEGVPKDYVGDAANAKNFYAVLSGNRSALSGGSGKVVDSGPNDTIFIYYSDHGAPGLVTMPVGEYVMANDFVNVLKKKHDAKSYKKMVIYLEACESGSMFEGILPNNISIYATTASNADEDSFAYYCPHSYPSPPTEYTTCLGDVYSISWLEDSDKNDMTIETLQQQYETVRRRTLIGNVDTSSHVKQYGDRKFENDTLATYIGAPVKTNPTNSANAYSFEPYSPQTRHVSQRDAHLLYLKLELQKAPDGSMEKLKAQIELDDEIAHRKHLDSVFHLIGDLLFGEENNISTMLLHVRPPGQPLVDDWDCFKTLIKTYESNCGKLSIYGRKYTRAFANMCNAGISEEQMVVASSQACPKENPS
uniref:Vacuolar-processing enzyme n=2 Tax=Cajanus cajan TaxID=3821 RepID=A0A151R8G0_CAJCA|nr:Vacuolar-processing enzyme [Cajanus cajan]